MEEHSAAAEEPPRDVPSKHNAPFGNANYVIVEEEVKIEKTEEATSIEDLQR